MSLSALEMNEVVLEAAQVGLPPSQGQRAGFAGKMTFDGNTF